jgi:hypothetical protein
MLGIILISLIFILSVIIFIYCIPKWFPSANLNMPINENFINIQDSALYKSVSGDSNKPSDIQYQIPIAQNQLTDLQLQSLDTDVLRNVRVLKNFSLTDELDFYQMYNLLKQFKDATYEFKYDTSNVGKYQVLKSEKIMELNTGAINSANLDLFYRLKLELISAFNNLIIRNGYYLPYHKYQFFKIINSNLISNTALNSGNSGNSRYNGSNYVFTITIAREFKYQQFVLYWDIDVLDSGNGMQTAKINKIELLGIPIPKTIEFHENRKTELINANANTDANSGVNPAGTDIYQLIKAAENKDKEKRTMLDIFQDQVSDSATFDVQPIGDGKKIFQSPATKFIDVNESSDMSPVLFDANSQNAMIENKIMNHARDKQFRNHRCYGLVNGISKELVEYNDNPIFCKSYHPEISQVGIWDAPCQVNSDCPFYQANRNYPNEFGKCNKQTGKCEMPLGVIPIGFTQYGKLEPKCYNCSPDIADNRCCATQARDTRMKSPDYIFLGDEAARREFADTLEKNGLKANPSI